MAKGLAPRGKKADGGHGNGSREQQGSGRKAQWARAAWNRRDAVEDIEGAKRRKRDMPQSGQAAAKRAVAVKEVLAMETQAQRRAGQKGRENEPPAGDKIERVGHRGERAGRFDNANLPTNQSFERNEHGEAGERDAAVRGTRAWVPTRAKSREGKCASSSLRQPP